MTTSNNKDSQKSATGTFSDAERTAMRARAQELKAEERMNKDRAEGEKAVIAAIEAMQESDRIIAKQLHVLIKESAPELSPKTWYGFPAYAKDGKVVCFFQYAEKFKTRYATFGFMDTAKLDEVNMWPVTFALTKLTHAEEAKIVALVKKAVS